MDNALSDCAMYSLSNAKMTDTCTYQTTQTYNNGFILCAVYCEQQIIPEREGALLMVDEMR